MNTTDPHTSAQAAASRSASPATAGTGGTATPPIAAAMGIVPGNGNTEFVTGAYQLSGHAGIDRMIALEKALKRFGTPL